MICCAHCGNETTEKICPGCGSSAKREIKTPKKNGIVVDFWEVLGEILLVIMLIAAILVLVSMFVMVIAIESNNYDLSAFFEPILETSFCICVFGCFVLFLFGKN